MLQEFLHPAAASNFAEDVRHGLLREGQKELPSKYLYDSLGSKLFEAICELPEYGLTRADTRLLGKSAPEIASLLGPPVLVCELGSGSGKKTRYILEALSRRRQLEYFPIEISATALAHCERELSDLERVGVVGLEKEYIDGLLEVAARRRPGQVLFVLFLGSTIGNFSPPADRDFLRQIRQILSPGDALLLGTDLVKPVWQLTAAYDDPLGVTAAFNRNLLVRVNRELHASFPLARFRHAARYNESTKSIEMHLVAEERLEVPIRTLGLTVSFAAGESIWTENCRKFELSDVESLALSAGFEIERQWVDSTWPFAENLLRATN
ncbi:MAG: L-histidine N(alpha)-methyltransferase [Bryobacter sp.]